MRRTGLIAAAARLWHLRQRPNHLGCSAMEFSRRYNAARDFIDDLPGPLEIVARELLSSPTGWQYEFEVWHGGARIARGRVAALAFALPPQATAGNNAPA